ncbi:ribokinase [Ruania alba]|uniref:Ribokinase n=1 Tax=Ruania alba TaxID=648782 RepID=A0A1H5MDZ0_9MICO|nr:ribokinase [Ruania alba]SEE87515.1 ribokinase [Ruania alba]
MTVQVRPSPILVIGSANLDYLIRVDVGPRPGETVLARSMLKAPGGKGANQAVAAARLGGDVRFVGCVGDDNDGALLMRELRAEGVDIGDVEIFTSHHTGMAVVAVERSGQNSIMVVPGANFALTESRVAHVLGRAEPPSLVVLQAEIQASIVTAAVEQAASSGARVVLNLAPFVALPARVTALCDPLVMNEAEAEALVGESIASLADARRIARELRRAVRSVVITLGVQGAVWADPDDDGVVPAEAVPHVVDTTGAGDAFVGALAVRLAAGAELRQAVGIGVAAGTFAVTRDGAQSSYAMASDLEMNEHVAG